MILSQARFMYTKFKIIVPWILVVVCMTGIFTLSAQDNSDSHVLSDGVAGSVATATVDGYPEMSVSEQSAVVKSFDLPVRKVAHFLEYALLGSLLFVAAGTIPWFRTRLVRRCAVGALVAGAFAAADEFHQVFSVGRTPLITDVMIDAAGAVVAILAACLVRWVWMKKHRLL